MTVSVLARDPVTGRLGLAVASFALAVGAGVPHLRAGVGVVAVQALSPPAWGAVALDALVAGAGAHDVVARLRRRAGAAAAQVAVVDAQGGAACFSGSACEPHVSAAFGDGVCSVANLMERPDVAPAVVDAFGLSTADDLGGRLLDALAAADELGGDLRGRQSAALRVTGDQDAAPFDLRVDDAIEPLAELRRLHALHLAHELLARARGADGLYRDVGAARAALAMAPDDRASLGALALALLRDGQPDAAGPLLQRLSRTEPRTAERLRRLVAGGRLDAASLQQAWPGALSTVDRRLPNGGR